MHCQRTLELLKLLQYVLLRHQSTGIQRTGIVKSGPYNVFVVFVVINFVADVWT